MRRVRLTRQEKAIEASLLKGEYVDLGKEDFSAIVQSLASRKKDAVLNLRINSYDLKNIKEKAHQLGLKYQTFISELLHRVAQA